MFVDRRVAIVAAAIAAVYSHAEPVHAPRAAPSCERRTAAKDFAAAAAACAQAFAERGDPGDALAAAQAERELHHDGAALALAARLLDGPRGAEARRLMARIQLDRDRFDLARPLLEDALRLDQARGDHAGAYADASRLGSAHWHRNDFGAALRWDMLACAEAEASHDRQHHATSLIALGSVYQAVGDAARALDAYAQATRELPRDDLAGRASVLINRGELLDDQRRYALALPLLVEARTLALQLNNLPLVLGAEENLADNALSRRDLDAAAHHLDGAEAAGRARGDKAPSQGILINRAILERYRGNFAAAVRALDAAAAGSAPSDTAWIVAHERGLVAAAERDVEAAEANYGAAIATVEAMWRTSSPEDLRAPFFETRWLPYQSLFALRVEHGEPAAAFATVASAQGRMFLAEAIAASADAGDAAARVDRLRALAPLMAASPLARPLGPTETLAALGDRYVLNYFAGGGRMRLLVIDHGRVRLASVDIELTRLEQLVDDFIARPDDPAAALALGAALLPPDALAAAPVRFHVIPDGPLLRVPFAALVAGGRRVVEDHEIVYAPSATGLAGLGTAAPVRATGAMLLGDARGDLPHAADDAAAVEAATHADARFGRQATIAALRAAQDASLLHIAGHSGVSADGGYLVLADGQATAADILTWRIRPRLVVLPTCASAVTQRRDMWGSLAAAFLAAGSRDVVATLFSVEDAAAAEFTARFYRHGGARDPVAATAAAQRELAARYPATAWSAFLVVGL